MAGVKGVGRKVISHIVEVRDGKPFESLDDLLSRIDLSKAPKSALEALVKVGALDKFGKRSAMIEVLPVVAERWGDVMRLKRAGQSGLFSEEIEKETTEKTILPDISEVPEQEKLQWEKELLGTYVSTHPTQKIHDLLKKTGVRTIVDIKKVRVGSRVKVLGVLDKVRVITTKNGKMMAFLDIQDHTGNIDVTLFPKIYDDNKDVLAEGKMVVIAGKLDSRGGYLGVLADKVYALDDAKLKSIRKKIKKINGGGKDQVIVKIPDSATMDQLEQLNSFFAQNPGDTKVTVIVPNHSGPRSVVLRNGVAMGAEALSHAETLVPGVSFE